MTQIEFWQFAYEFGNTSHGRHVAWRRLKRLGVHLPNPRKNPPALIRASRHVAKQLDQVGEAFAALGRAAIPLVDAFAAAVSEFNAGVRRVYLHADLKNEAMRE